MMLAFADLRDQSDVRVRLGIVPDEESEEEAERGGDLLVAEGFIGDFVITGEPTDMHIGVAAEGRSCDARCEVDGRAAHGATPWLGENAILKALDVFRAIESLPFASPEFRAVRPAVDQPRPHPGRRCTEQGARHLRHRRRRPLSARAGPRGDPRRGRELPGATVVSTFRRAAGDGRSRARHSCAPCAPRLRRITTAR